MSGELLSHPDLAWTSLTPRLGSKASPHPPAARAADTGWLEWQQGLAGVVQSMGGGAHEEVAGVVTVFQGGLHDGV